MGKTRETCERRQTTQREHQRLRDEHIWEIVQQYYEPRREDRSKRWVWRTKIYPQWPMSERSFWRALERHEKRRKDSK